MVEFWGIYVCIYQKKVVSLHSISKVFFFPFGATACGRTFQCPTTSRLAPQPLRPITASIPQPPRPKIEVL